MLPIRPPIRLVVIAIIAISGLAASIPATARDSWEPEHCRDLNGQAFGLCHAYCDAMPCWNS